MSLESSQPLKRLLTPIPSTSFVVLARLIRSLKTDLDRRSLPLLALMIHSTESTVNHNLTPLSMKALSAKLWVAVSWSLEARYWTSSWIPIVGKRWILGLRHQKGNGLRRSQLRRGHRGGKPVASPSKPSPAPKPANLAAGKACALKPGKGKKNTRQVLRDLVSKILGRAGPGSPTSSMDSCPDEPMATLPGWGKGTFFGSGSEIGI